MFSVLLFLHDGPVLRGVGLHREVYVVVAYAAVPPVHVILGAAAQAAVRVALAAALVAYAALPSVGARAYAAVVTPAPV